MSFPPIANSSKADDCACMMMLPGSSSGFAFCIFKFTMADKKASYMENGENCDGIGGRQDGSKVEDVEEPEGNGYELSEAVHDPSDDEGGDGGQDRRDGGRARARHCA